MIIYDDDGIGHNVVSMKVIEDIKQEIKDLHNSHMIHFVSADGAVDTCIEIIDKHTKGGE